MEDLHSTPYRVSGNGVEESRYAPSATAAGSEARKEAGRWAEAFHKNALAHQNSHSSLSANAEPQPSRRPTPHTATTTKVLSTASSHSERTVASTVTTLSTGSNPASRSQSQSTHGSPLPRFSDGSAGGAESMKGGATAAAPRVVTSRPVAAVAVHPPLSRGSRRAAAATANATAGAAVEHALCAVPEGQSPRPLLPPPPPPAELRQAGSGSFGSATAPAGHATTTPNRAAAGPPARPVATAYSTPHARFSGGGKGHAGFSKARPLSQVDLAQTASGGAAHTHENSPVASAATPHIPSAYASSPFFQRVAEAAPQSPLPADATPHGPRDGDGDDSALLQEVTPISHGGGSWRQESQLLSQPRDAEANGVAARTAQARGPAGEQETYGGFSPATDAAGNAMAGLGTLHNPAVSQLRPPPSLPISGQVLRRGTASPPAPAAAASGCVPQCWPAEGPCQLGSPYPQSLYCPPEYAGSAAKAASNRSACGPFASPYTPAEVTRLSASPGGLTGSHNTSAQLHSGMLSAMTPHTTMAASGMPMAVMSNHGGRPATAAAAAAAGSVSDSAAAAAAYYLPSSVSGGQYSPYVPSAQPYVDAGMGGSPHDYHSCRSYPSQYTSPYQHYSSAAGPAAAAAHASYALAGPVPAVCGTTATTTAAIASGLSGVALERQLLHASKAELVQILLELGSCNPEASRFIDAKAFFFAFRHEHSRVPADHGETAVSEAPQGEQAGGSCRSSSTRSIARCIFPPATTAAPAERDEEEEEEAGHHAPGLPAEPSLSGGPGQKLTAAKAATAPVVERRGRPEERTFCDAVHPCLRWYGACRNATSCAYASLPRNLCLNWVRGACVAHTECSGVHRLPEPCPPELQTIYRLNHGVSRAKAGAALRDLPAAPTPATTKPLAGRPLAAEASTRVSWRSERRSEPEACPAGVTAMPPSDPDNADPALHTPHNQSLHRDAVVGGDSTPHRHPNGRPGCHPTFLSAHHSPWSAMDQDSEETVEEMLASARAFAAGDEGDGEGAGEAALLLRRLHANNAASRSASSCGSAEDRAMSELVNRCLRKEFDSVQSPLSPTCTTAMPTELAAAAGEGAAADAHEVLAGACDGRRSPVLLRASLCSVAAQVGGLAMAATGVTAAQEEEEADEYADCAAPAAGTRTRVQSPAYA